MRTTRSAAGAAALITFGMLALCWPLLDLSGPYVGPMFAYVSRMLAHVGPICWPKLALSGPYVGLMVAYVGAMLA